jgi:hypothetical protein
MSTVHGKVTFDRIHANVTQVIRRQQSTLRLLLADEINPASPRTQAERDPLEALTVCAARRLVIHSCPQQLGLLPVDGAPTLR